jgi:energy-coupling factor transport system ATP-binding protein
MHITHDLADIADADRAVVLDRGAVVFAGTVEELERREDLLGEWGLELPPLARLTSALRALGAPLPAKVPDAETMAGSLWP